MGVGGYPVHICLTLWKKITDTSMFLSECTICKNNTARVNFVKTAGVSSNGLKLRSPFEWSHYTVEMNLFRSTLVLMSVLF